MVKIGGKVRLTLQFFSCIFRDFKNALRGQHGRTRLHEILHMKGLSSFRNPAVWQQIAFKIEEFFPAGQLLY
jgi:hypothetical protein